MIKNKPLPKYSADDPRKPLTLKERAFADEYSRSGVKTHAVMAVYDVNSVSGAGAMGTTLTNKPNVRAYLESKAQEMANIVTDLAKDSAQDSVRLAAAKDVLDRAGYKPIEKTQSLHVTANLTPNGNSAQNATALLELRQKYEAELQQTLINSYADTPDTE